MSAIKDNQSLNKQYLNMQIHFAAKYRVSLQQVVQRLILGLERWISKCQHPFW